MRGWAALVGALGFVALLFALVAVLLLLFSGASSGDLLFLWGNLGAGVVLLGIALFASLDDLRERMQSSEGRRVGKYGTSAILSTVLAIAIVALLGYLGTQNSLRFDWTEASVHSLADQTLKVLDGLDRDVEVTAFFPPADRARVRPLLDKYTYASERFHLTWADPASRPDLVEKLGITREQLGGGVLHISLGGESTVIDDVGEERITNALVKLTRTAEKKVYFLTGHNERPADGDAANEEGGFGRAADALRNENYQVASLVLATVGDVPDDADVVIIPGPTRPFLSEEHSALQRYLERGGALLVLVDPLAKTDLYADLDRWGVSLGDDFIVDQLQALAGSPLTPVANGYNRDHPITKDLREVTLFHVARSVEVEPEMKDRFQPIVYTSESSWAERNLEAEPKFDGDDVRGPVAIAAAGFPLVGEAAADTPPDREEGARLVLVGDSDFATNELIDAYRNRDLFVNSVNWLLGDVEAISVRPNQSRASRFQLTADQFARIRYLSLFVLPEVLAVLGAVSWWWRRRAPGR